MPPLLNRQTVNSFVLCPFTSSTACQLGFRVKAVVDEITSPLRFLDPLGLVISSTTRILS